MSASVSRVSTANGSDYEKDEKLVAQNQIGAIPYADSDGSIVENDEAADRRLVKKIDRRLLPMISILYGLSLIDRTNLGLAKVNGMGKALGLSGNNHYSVALVMFYVGYLLFELPSTLVLRKLKPRNFLAAIFVAWGADTIAVGFSADWKQLVTFRTLLGVFESGFFPACVYLISCWYKRYEISPRLNIFYMSSVLAAGFGAILAYIFHQMDGLGNTAGWRWIFIMLGIITVTTGCISWFFIVDFPNTATFLTDEERRQTLYRLEQDRGDSVPDPVTLQKALKHLCDIEVWTLGIAYGAASVATNSFPYFIPIILQTLGFKGALSSLLVAPPFVAAVIVSIPISWLTDKYRIRSPFIIGYILVGLAGFILINSDDVSSGVKLFATFLCVAGSYPQIPMIVSMLQNNIRSDSKRAVASGFSASFAGFGGIIASTIYRDQDFPEYHFGLIGTLICHGVVAVCIGGTAILFHYRNRKLDAAAAEANLSEADIARLSVKERSNHYWRYTL